MLSTYPVYFFNPFFLHFHTFYLPYLYVFNPFHFFNIHPHLPYKISSILFHSFSQVNLCCAGPVCVIVLHVYVLCKGQGELVPHFEAYLNDLNTDQFTLQPSSLVPH